MCKYRIKVKKDINVKVDSCVNFNLIARITEITVFPVLVESNTEIQQFMTFEIFRLVSFSNQNFPSDDDMSVTRLAAAGFYFNSVTGLITCAFCRALYGNFPNGEMPHGPGCQAAHLNRPLSVGLEGLDPHTLANFYRWHGTLRPNMLEPVDETPVAHSSQTELGVQLRYNNVSPIEPQSLTAAIAPVPLPEQQELALLNDSDGREAAAQEAAAGSPVYERTGQSHDSTHEPQLSVSSMIFSSFVGYGSRIETFDECGSISDRSKQDLATAGYFHANGAVRCYYCGFRLTNWQMLNPTDQTVLCHPHCDLNSLYQSRNNIDLELLDKQKTMMALLLAENALLRQRTCCRKCNAREIHTIFLPCGHVACIECAEVCNTCSVCKQRILDTSRIYL